MDDVTGMSLHLREIKNIDELKEIRDEWAELYDSSPIAAPFQSPAWLINWWKYFGNDQLWTVAIYNRRILVGLAPMYIFNYKSGRGILRQVTFMGTGNTDYMDILCRPEYETESVRMLAGLLAISKEGWDACDFQELRQFSPMLKIKVPGEFEVNVTRSDICPVTMLPETFEEYLSMLPVSFRKNTLRAKRRLADSGKLSLELAVAENLAEYFDWLFRLHNASWQNRNMPGLFENDALKEFHKDTAWDLFRQGILRLYVLKHNTRIIAAVYSMIKNKRLYYYIGGFDPELAKYSPGSVCLLGIMEYSIAEGLRKFDFLRGREKYKYKWNAVDRTNYRLFINKHWDL